MGNPPFIGGWKLRQCVGDGYVDALWSTYSNVPNKADYVMYWWELAACKVRDKNSRQFGFITTNSLRQTFNRRVVSQHLDADDEFGITYAVPDHPWVDSADGADVRISMTVAASAPGARLKGVLATLVPERTGTHATRGEQFLDRSGVIQPDLTLGVDLDAAVPLMSNAELSFAGVKLHGAGFIVTPEESTQLTAGAPTSTDRVIREYRNGRDLTRTPRGVKVIDLFGMEPHEIQRTFPAIYQRVVNHVKPERDQNRDRSIREHWWLHGRPRPEMRLALAGLDRFIATVETSKHRFFTFLDSSILPDNMVITFALRDGFYLGVMSSRVHVTWALAAGGRMGVGNDPRYQNLRCFDPFPFPVIDEVRKQTIRDLAEHLDAHRKRQQELHPKLTMTGMYNVLEKLRAGETLTAKEQAIHEQGLVSVLKQIHDDLDAAVFDAYGWPLNLTDEQILERLVALNQERAEEEARGIIRWLRPEFQNPDGIATQKALEMVIETAAVPTAPAAKRKKEPWPNTLPDRVRAVRSALAEESAPVTSDELAKRFTRAKKDAVAELLETLAEVGQARRTDDGRYVA